MIKGIEIKNIPVEKIKIGDEEFNQKIVIFMKIGR